VRNSTTGRPTARSGTGPGLTEAAGATAYQQLTGIAAEAPRLERTDVIAGFLLTDPG
jgi:hypothetical protein